MKKSIYSSPLAFLWNLCLAYVCYAACRGIYLAENWSAFSEGLSALSLTNLFWGSFKFDSSAIFYTNALYLLLMLLPLHWKERAGWQKTAKWIFLIVNSLAIIVNLADAVYFKYTGRRTTSSVFQEFSHENNLGQVFGAEIVQHWYLFIAGLVMIIALYMMYVEPKGKLNLRGKAQLIGYYLMQLLALGIAVPVTVGAMRGGFTKAVRPITISNANQYVNRPTEAALVLNTPFSMIRTVNKSVFKDPKFYDRAELDGIYSPVHTPSDSIVSRKKNVVVLIVESFGKEYVGALNNGEGYTPFVDSLMQHSLTYEYTFSNGRKSIDGMPSVLSGIPRFNEPFFLTPASLNDVSGIAGELKKSGYQTAFFHGAENGSMGFEAFARATGYQQYYGRTEYKEDKRFDGDKDYDGTWAIWDEEFLQFYALKMSELQEPFCTTVFTASSHHPYVVPAKYKDIYKDEPGDDNIMHKCVRYADFSLKRFFETAKKQDWYKNTLFVLTADHTNLTSKKEYQTDLGVWSVPILFFDPSGEMETGMREGIAQQTDIMPTVLNYLGHPTPYVAWGKDLLHTPDSETWAVNQENGVYQYVTGDYILQMMEDGKVKGLYNYKTDWFMKENLEGKLPEVEEPMAKVLKAIIQSYMIRMTEDQLIVK